MQLLVVGLIVDGTQALGQRETGSDQRRELPREDHLVLHLDAVGELHEDVAILARLFDAVRCETLAKQQLGSRRLGVGLHGRFDHLAGRLILSLVVEPLHLFVP